MKKILLGVLFLPALAVSQQMQGPVKVDKTVICGPIEDVLKTIANEYKEKPIWGSKMEDSRIVLTVNDDTKTWSILQFNDKVACMIDSGAGFFFARDNT